MTDQEMKTAWQNEPDADELSEMANEIKRSFDWKKAVEDSAPSIDVEEQWKRFRANHPMKTSLSGWHRWAVAASLLLLCSIGFALGWPFLKEWRRGSLPAVAKQDITVVETDNTVLEDSTKLTFRNSALSSILEEIARRHDAEVDYKCQEELYMYVELEKAWSLQQCIDFLNHFEHVNLSLSADNTIVAQ